MKPDATKHADLHGETWAYLILFLFLYVLPLIVILLAVRYNRRKREEARAEQFALFQKDNNLE